MPTYRTLKEINSYYGITGFMFLGEELTAIVCGTRKHYTKINKKRKIKVECTYDRELDIFINIHRNLDGQTQILWKE